MSDKRKQIIDAAIRLFYRDGFWNTSTASVAREAGIASGTLFNYFATKSELIDQVYVALKEDLAATLVADFPAEADVKQQARTLWSRYFRWHLDRPTEHALMKQLRISELVSSDVVARQNESFAFALDVFQRGIDDGTLANLPMEFLAAFTEASLEAAIAHARQAWSSTHNVAGSEPGNADVIEDMAFTVYWRAISR